MEIEMKKTKVKINKPIYVGVSILDISKILMYQFWYDYIKPKYQDRGNLCYMDTECFVIHIKTEKFYENIANNIEKLFEISSYNEDDKRPLPIGKNKKVISIFKDELGGKIMIFVGLIAKTYAYSMDEDTEHKKAKGTKGGIIKRELEFRNYKDCLFNVKIILKLQQRFKSDCHNVYTLNKQIRLR